MNNLSTIMKEIETVLNGVKEEDIIELTVQLQRAKRIFVAGEGRSGLMVKAFAMRLMHLGANVFVIGETITPAINNDDILIALSGSGITHNVVWISNKAKSIGCTVIAITSNIESPLANTTKDILHVPAATKLRQENEFKTIQPLGSLFDQCVHILFDIICIQYSRQCKVDHQQAFDRHSNLE